MAFTHVDKPFRIKGLELKNRIVRTAHSTSFGGGVMSEDSIAYHEARARGGVGLSIIEPLSVHPSSNSIFNSWTPGLEAGYRKLVAACHGHDMKLFQQLRHAGIQHKTRDGGPSWSASDVASSKLAMVPIPMTQEMIDEVVAGYAHVAQLAEEWGLDGVEVQCAHSYLPHQFLSPAYNKRTDKYGGGLENRARFMLEVLTAVRKAVSKDFVVGVRVSPDYQIGSVTPDDVLGALRLLESHDLIDFADVSAGNYQTDYKMLGGMDEAVGYQLLTSAPITRNVKSPTIVAGRIRTLDDADLIIREGNADLVAITRATIADPDLVRKSLAGQGTKVRPCIGCNQGCIGGIMSAVTGGAGRMTCVVNPVVGFERTMGDEKLTPAPEHKKVLVIGGGVGGMEAARVAALRGHQVILAEAQNKLGGMALIAAKAPSRHGVHDIAVWQENEIYELGVDVRLSTYMDVNDVIAEAPDAVIVATGASPRMDGIVLSNPGEPIQGFEQPHVISSVDLFTGMHPPLGKSALVIDDVGHYEGMGVAEELLNRGLEVTFVTRHVGIGHQLDNIYVTSPTLGRFAHDRFTLHSRSHVLSIAKNTAIIAPVYIVTSKANARRTVPADTVVFVSDNRPNRDLFVALENRKMDVRVIGDARAPRLMEVAIREGYLAGMAV